MPAARAYAPKRIPFMTNDWQSSLESLLSSGSLPEGDDPLPDAAPPKKTAKLNISIEKKGRAGKTATIISGFDPDDDIDAVATTLKTKLGTGGSARGGEILIQGDRRNDVSRLLNQMGYK